MPTIPKRPPAVTLTLWGVFLLGVWNLGRAIAWARQGSILFELGATPDPRLWLVVAVVWGVVFLGLTLALRQRRPLVRQAIPISLLLYAAYRLSLPLFFTQAPLNYQGWLLESIIYAAAIAFTQWALNRSGTKSYFEVRD